MNELDVRREEELITAFRQADHFVTRKYLSELTSYDVIPLPEELARMPVSRMVRLSRVTKLVYDAKENTLDKLSSVYHTLAGSGLSLVLIVHSDGKETELYVGTRTEPDPARLAAGHNALRKALSGNFPGSELAQLRNDDIEALMDRVFRPETESGWNAIAAVSGVASLRTDDKSQFVQGLEKLIDAMRGDAFTAVFVADPLEVHHIREIRLGYEQLYTQLAPFAETDLTFGQNESHAVSEGLSSGIAESVNESVTLAQSVSRSNSKTNGMSTNYGINIGSKLRATIFGGFMGRSNNDSTVSAYSSTDNESHTTGTGKTRSKQQTKSDTFTDGSSRTLQIKMENKTVRCLLDIIEEQLKRLREGEDLGLWKSAAYFIANDVQTAKIAAHTYKALMRGANSSVESAAVNTWDGGRPRPLLGVANYIRKLHHPLFRQRVPGVDDRLPAVSPATITTGMELAIQAGLPFKSVAGLPVMQSAAFGRNVVTYEQIPSGARTIPLGRIFHMGKPEATPVSIDADSLTMHAFITGSTGAGKTNALTGMLDRLDRIGVRFLVIEPAKGEYKHVLGGRPDVRVFGTNPRHTELLRLNPFKFPAGIHVLEHIDRLIEIFNACWPMYAAMPAILKEAVEQAYLEAGWDLIDSTHYGDEPSYPTFHNLLAILPELIRKSEYSQEVQSNYTGALVTRVRSLTNGLYGLIFCGEETDNEALFDGNCIVDLSRVGSTETKSLLMGMLVMRLQERRMTEEKGMNLPLRHVTVLEEAHQLLRRTSTEQSQEGANLQGKAVEMLANAIAEMRTYGEGFLIVDQSPSLLDLSVIRNTNTKIILRLPEEQDRRLVGGASNLKDEQIAELAKLKVGVAAVYQNNWLEPVLCVMDRFTDVRSYEHRGANALFSRQRRERLGELSRLLLAARVSDEPHVEASGVDANELLAWVKEQHWDAAVKQAVERQIRQWSSGRTPELWGGERFPELAKLVFDLYRGSQLLQKTSDAEQLDEWHRRMREGVLAQAEFGERGAEWADAVIQCLLREKSAESEAHRQFYFAWIEHAVGRPL